MKIKNSKKKACLICGKLFYPKGLPAHEKAHKKDPDNSSREDETHDLSAIILCIGDGSHRGFLLNGSHLEELNLTVINV